MVAVGCHYLLCSNISGTIEEISRSFNHHCITLEPQGTPLDKRRERGSFRATSVWLLVHVVSGGVSPCVCVREQNCAGCT